MLLPDVRDLIYAHIEDSVPEHPDYAAWITRLATGQEPFALFVLVLAGFVRVVTNPRVFAPPSTLDLSFAFISSLVERPTARIVGPGPDHLDIFERLCRVSGAPGSWSLTPSTRRLQSSTVAPWFRPTPISADSQDFDGCTHYGKAGCSAAPSQYC